MMNKDLEQISVYLEKINKILANRPDIDLAQVSLANHPAPDFSPSAEKISLIQKDYKDVVKDAIEQELNQDLPRRIFYKDSQSPVENALNLVKQGFFASSYTRVIHGIAGVNLSFNWKEKFELEWLPFGTDFEFDGEKKVDLDFLLEMADKSNRKEGTWVYFYQEFPQVGIVIFDMNRKKFNLRFVYQYELQSSKITELSKMFRHFGLTHEEMLKLNSHNHTSIGTQGYRPGGAKLTVLDNLYSLRENKLKHIMAGHGSFRPSKR